MRKKVFVSGCFDRLHSGHITFLQQAFQYGDVYVGIGSDKTIYSLKNRYPLFTQLQRLYMIKSIKYVKDAWINSGNGILDFIDNIKKLKPDILFVNSDGLTNQKKIFCQQNNIQLIISQRSSKIDLPIRSTTKLRQCIDIPYRIQLCGGWLDQLFLNSIYPGSVIVAGIQPNYIFNKYSGMATSSRNKAIQIWNGKIPNEDKQKLAKILFCCQNPPGTKNISGSQDQLGILLPGLNKLNYNNNFWPISIDNILDNDILSFIEDNIYLIELKPRQIGWNIFKTTHIEQQFIKQLSIITDKCWTAILNKNIKQWGQYTTKCLEIQSKIFPQMLNQNIINAINNIKDKVYGYKMTGCGGGGYLICISDRYIENSIKIKIIRK